MDSPEHGIGAFGQPPSRPWRFESGLPGRAVALRVGLLAAVIGGFAVVAYQDLCRARDLAVADALRQTRNLALTLEADVVNTVRSADQAVLALIDSVGAPLAATPPNGQPALESSHAPDSLPAVRSLIVADAEGLVRYASGGFPAGTVAGSDLFEALREPRAGGFHLSRPFRAGTDGGWRIAVSRRLEEPGGGFGGVAAAVIDLRRFSAFYASLDVGDHGFVSLWHDDGSVLAVSRTIPAAELDPYAFAHRLPRFDDGRREHTLTGVSAFDDEERVGSVRAVEGLPLHVLVRLGAKDYLASWREGLWQRGLETAALSAVLILLVARLLRHLSRLERTTSALSASERRFQALFDSSFQVMGLLAPDGRVLALNQPACALAGLPPDRIIGRPAWEFDAWVRTEEAAERFRRFIATAAAGNFVRYETGVLTGQAGLRVLDVSIKPVFDEAGTVALMVIEARDITDRKRAEDSLRASEARLRSYMDAAMEGFFISGERGRFIDVNPAACASLGYERDELLALRASDLIALDHPLGPASLAGFRTVEASGLFRGEMALRRKDGGILRAEVNAVRLDDGLYLGVTRDVTERRLAEEALRASTGRLSALVNALPDLVFILDAEGRYREVIANAGALLSCPAEQMIGRKLEEVLPPDTAAPLRAMLERTLDEGQPQRTEYPLSLGTEKHWFEGRAQRLASESGRRPMVLLLSRDITERVEAAERLAAAKEMAEAANRAKGAFLATMSHELRTPLNAIIGFSDIMLHELFGPLGSPRYQDYARHVQSSGRHLLDLINDVLDMSKLEAGRLNLEEAWIDVAETLDGCRALAAVAADRAGVALTVSLPPNPPGLFADERAVRQILLNLLSNAVKFTPAGGRVTVTAETRGPEGSFAVIVRDSGIGIAPDALARIAEPFQQADSSIARRFGGTGLGLSISRELIELHGGELRIDSLPGQGTTVTVSFPSSRVRGPVAETARSA